MRMWNAEGTKMGAYGWKIHLDWFIFTADILIDTEWAEVISTPAKDVKTAFGSPIKYISLTVVPHTYISPYNITLPLHKTPEKQIILVSCYILSWNLIHIRLHYIIWYIKNLMCFFLVFLHFFSYFLLTNLVHKLTGKVISRYIYKILALYCLLFGRYWT